jgi:RNA polymerase sigma-70 factor (ECF subfamily)
MMSAVFPLWSTMLAPVAEGDRANDLEVERGLVLAAQSGDRQALGKLLTAYGSLLYRSVLLPRLGSEAAAKDALGETYAKVVERIGQFTWQGVGVYPWLRTVALRVAIDMLRMRSRVVLWEEDDLAREVERDTTETPVDARLSALRDEQAAKERVKAALALLHPRYARAIQVRLLDEQPREEAARLLEVTPATFDVLLHRALRALKNQLATTPRGQG